MSLALRSPRTPFVASEVSHLSEMPTTHPSGNSIRERNRASGFIELAAAISRPRPWPPSGLRAARDGLEHLLVQIRRLHVLRAKANTNDAPANAPSEFRMKDPPLRRGELDRLRRRKDRC